MSPGALDAEALGGGGPSSSSGVAQPNMGCCSPAEEAAPEGPEDADRHGEPSLAHRCYQHLKVSSSLSRLYILIHDDQL